MIMFKTAIYFLITILVGVFGGVVVSSSVLKSAEVTLQAPTTTVPQSIVVSNRVSIPPPATVSFVPEDQHTIVKMEAVSFSPDPYTLETPCTIPQVHADTCVVVNHRVSNWDHGVGSVIMNPNLIKELGGQKQTTAIVYLTSADYPIDQDNTFFVEVGLGYDVLGMKANNAAWAYTQDNGKTWSKIYSSDSEAEYTKGS